MTYTVDLKEAKLRGMSEGDRAKPVAGRPPRYKCPGWNTWKNIKYRCRNKNCKDYKWYGARGITVSDEFFDNFYVFSDYLKTLDGFDQWMENKEGSEEITLDRIDNKRGYERGNLRFSNWESQNNNRGLRKDNSTGFNCVVFRRDTRKYVAKIRINRKYVYLGNHATPELANMAIKKFKSENNL